MDSEKNIFEPKMTVGELIRILLGFPQDMPVAVNYDIYEAVNASIQTWTHDNYPYDKPDVEFVNIS